MKGHFSPKSSIFFVIGFFILFFCFKSARSASAATSLTEEQRRFYALNNIFAIGDCTPGASFQISGTPVSGSVFQATPYSDLTEGQLRGIMAAVKEENAGNLNAIRYQASIMANLVERDHPDWAGKGDKLIEYASTTWFAANTKATITNQEFSDYTAEEMQAVVEVLKEGKRALPTYIDEHDQVEDLASVKINGEDKDKNTISSYVKDQTTINNIYESTYTFYDWANPNGTVISSSSEGNGTGDVYGYTGSAGSPSSSSSSSSPSSSEATGTETSAVSDTPSESSSAQTGTEETSAVEGNSSGGSSLGTSGTINTTSSGSAVNYKGDKVLEDSDIAKIKELQPLYEEAVKGTNVPWQVLATIHYREHSLSKENASNGQGIFQLYDHYIAGETFPTSGEASDEEFIRQAKMAAEDFAKAIPDKYNINSAEGIKFGFFAYNGQADAYKAQALALGFSQDGADIGEGSPYVMNRYDAQRDPTAGADKWGQIKSDGGGIEYPANNDFGAFVVYTALTGGAWSSTGGTTNAIDACDSASLVDGNSTGGNGGELIAAKARELAWSDTSHYNEVNPSFLAAAKALGEGTRNYCGGDAELDFAQDCGIFVSTVVRSTGIDPDFPKSYTPDLEHHMSNSSLWTEIENTGSEDNLLPGDIFVVNAGSHGYGSKEYPDGGGGGAGHIFIYLGGEDKTASASLCGRSGNLKEDVQFSSSGTQYRIFRSTVQSGISGGSVGSFDEELKALEKDGRKVGAAVAAPGTKDVSQVQVGGSWLTGRAWSTIKVPLSIAATQKNASTGSVTDPYGETCSHDLSSAINVAITQSNNCGAWWLWTALGGDNSSAADSVTSVIKSGGDSGTTVVSSGDGKSLTSGKTEWSLAGQAIFAANMASISGASSVMSEMKVHNASDGSYGLNIYDSAMTKGGWGSDDGGATRQFGIVKVSDGKCMAVAIGTNGNAQFSTLTAIVSVLNNHADSLPTGSCPSGF
ncbi:hypothetical protein IKG02_01550 [Candidatus Saccharibacteria bacterium]|nr:hypothetical protein [Candidatus Saccharibacteria bacterium]